MKKLALILAVVLLSACSSLKPVKTDSIALPGGTSMTLCEDVAKIDEATLAAIVKNHVDLLKKYKACRDNHKDLVDFVTKDKGL